MKNAYWFIHEPGKAEGPPPSRDWSQGLWWSWATKPDVDSRARNPLIRNDYINKLSVDVAKGQSRRVASIDPEGLQEPDAFISAMLKDFSRRRVKKSLLISKWVGQSTTLSAQDALAAMKSVVAGEPTANGEMLQYIAEYHRPIVEKCRMVTSYGIVDSPEYLDFALDWITTTGEYVDVVYPGMESCIWLCGSHQRVAGRPPLTVEESHRVAGTVFASRHRSLALYGGVEENVNLGAVIGTRLRLERKAAA